MFKFNFDIEDADDEASIIDNSVEKAVASQSEVSQNPFKELPVQHLLDSLPSQLSCSPITITLQESADTIHLARRDLFDARFQAISEGTGVPENENDALDPHSALAFLEAPSDLVPGVYEGGLKTWECSLDLVDYLRSLEQKGNFFVFGKRILEIGCGTAVPSTYLLNAIFSSTKQDKDTVLHLQDYNDSALELVTFPNILLAWYMSPASASFRSTVSDANQSGENDSPIFPPPDPSSPAEIPITTEMKAAFETSLREYRIIIRFFSGSWNTFDLERTGGKYDIVLTSETIYRVDSLPSLLDLLFNACKPAASVTPPDPDTTSRLVLSSEPSYLCLVAAKVFYFGVGGGTTEFVQAVEQSRDRNGQKAEVKTVWEKNTGVKRKIMQLAWNVT
ncbi:hypothetical protein K435DRAFT_826596 [Dendrothele bispora CBS 962.96]|uniref:protein-histidine N-methyltransferase n=1 Tax=Dendrothele bispora (strain CBS 962.96) TaxID=1314807 RepID=A0A4S8MRW4_DENBC|nr:hypothetical protein K435DRAFT_826596 [Dendrothele bispora CBS 962.96]